MSHPDQIWVVAPKGFRPSAWVEMLIDFDECYDLDPHLIDRRRASMVKCWSLIRNFWRALIR
ncbi:hypothetical protein ABS71_10195 [bacterium SCN 62-11]|nr:MAG: hypothetical protein ABS71_10195 [bacterium SCN 62-11]